MTQLNQIIDRVQEITMDIEMPASHKKEHIKGCIKNYATDILNLYRNIEATSLNAYDKQERIEALAAQFDLTIINEKFY